MFAHANEIIIITTIIHSFFCLINIKDQLIINIITRIYTTEPLTNIFRKFLAAATVPEDWKLAIVTPLFKYLADLHRQKSDGACGN